MNRMKKRSRYVVSLQSASIFHSRLTCQRANAIIDTSDEKILVVGNF
jgi:hypothetical protein